MELIFKSSWLYEEGNDTLKILSDRWLHLAKLSARCKTVVNYIFILPFLLYPYNPYLYTYYCSNNNNKCSFLFQDKFVCKFQYKAQGGTNEVSSLDLFIYSYFFEHHIFQAMLSCKLPVFHSMITVTNEFKLWYHNWSNIMRVISWSPWQLMRGVGKIWCFTFTFLI